MAAKASIYRPELTGQPQQPPSGQMQALHAKYAQAKAQADAIQAQIKQAEAAETLQMEALAKQGAASSINNPPQPGGMMPIPPNAPVPAGPSFGPMVNPMHPAPAMNTASPAGMPPGVQGGGMSPGVQQMLMQVLGAGR